MQLCIVHQVRNSLSYVSYKDRKAVAADLKKIYKSATIEETEQHLAALGQTRDARYPTIHRSWDKHWKQLTGFFAYPPEILHDQRHRVAEQLDAQNPESPSRLSQRRGGDQVDVSGPAETSPNAGHGL